MFGKVSDIVIGLLKALYGLSFGTNASTINPGGGSTGVTTVKGNLYVENAAGARTHIAGDKVGLGDTGDLSWNNNSDGSGGGDTGLARAAAGVISVTAGTGGGTGWLQNSAGRAALAADGTNSTITPATTGLSVTLKAGRTYSFKLVLFVEETTAADGLRVDFDGGTATATAFIQNGIVTDTVGVRSLAQTTALATDVTDATTTGAAMAVFEGTITVNAAGTFIPRYAKEADAAGAALNIRRGSHLIVEDMP